MTMLPKTVTVKYQDPNTGRTMAQAGMTLLWVRDHHSLAVSTHGSSDQIILYWTGTDYRVDRLGLTLICEAIPNPTNKIRTNRD